ncbi:MAG: hypothetical protein PVH60_08565, partial [Anaerolineales bacterium]
MRIRLLVFDPDIAGRRLMREVLNASDLELTLISRASGKTAAEAVNSMTLDGIVVGLPAKLTELIPLFSDIQSTAQCPPLFFLHTAPSPRKAWFTKDREGLHQLIEQLLPVIRAYKLRQAIGSLQAFLGQVKGSARTFLANQITDILAELEIPAMYVSFSAGEYFWELRSSNFPSNVVSQVITITDRFGGVKTAPDELNGVFKKLFSGAVDDHTFSSMDFFSSLMPLASEAIWRQLDNVLAVSAIHVVAIRSNHELNGFLLLGFSPKDAERDALQAFGRQFSRLLTQAEEYDLLSQQARSMKALQEVMLDLSAVRDPSDLLDNVLNKLELVVPFDLAGIGLFGEQGLKMHAARGEPIAFQDLNPARSKDDGIENIVAWLAEQQNPTLITLDEIVRRSSLEIKD